MAGVRAPSLKQYAPILQNSAVIIYRGNLITMMHKTFLYSWTDFLKLQYIKPPIITDSVVQVVRNTDI